MKAKKNQEKTRQPYFYKFFIIFPYFPRLFSIDTTLVGGQTNKITPTRHVLMASFGFSGDMSNGKIQGKIAKHSKK